MRTVGTLICLAAFVLSGGARAADFDAGLRYANNGNFAAAVREWRPLADSGDARAQYHLGDLYEAGRGVAPDAAEAARWYEKAAGQGHGQALNALGALYAQGRGVAVDRTRAYVLFDQAARAGDGFAAVNRETLADRMTRTELAEARAALAGEAGFAVIRIAYLTREPPKRARLSNLDKPIADEGVMGGRMAIAENITTGRFTGQHFMLIEQVLPGGGDSLAAFRDIAAAGFRHVVVDLPADELLAIADAPEAAGAQIYNAGAPDDALRNDGCRANLVHLLPSRGMLADALAQFLVFKRWTRWFLVVGRRAGDRLYAQAVRRAARRFGARIVAERDWTYGPDARRTAQAEVPLFTQGVDYDILVVADEIGEFGEYLAYRTWDARPVAGTQGLTPTAWHRTHEQWGAAQLQNRFRDQNGRFMSARDYAVWAAVRAIGEAATRSGSGDFDAIVAYMKGPEFGLAGFKGRKLSFRAWNGQLRQPVLLAAPRALVSVSPQQGFLHPVTELDTLGYDAPETGCRLD